MKQIFIMMIIAVTAMATNVLGVEWIVNGSFETPVVVNVNNWAVFTSVDGWDINWTSFSYQPPDEGPEGPELEVWRNPTPEGDVWSYSGDQCVELDSYDPTTISQVVPTIPGMEYELTYAWRPRPGVDCAMAVMINASTVDMYNDEDFEANSCGWRTESHTFVAASESSLIAFAEVGPDETVGGLGMLLDAVSLVNLEPLGCDSATVDGFRILDKGNWFMFTYAEVPQGPDYVGINYIFDIQAGNPENGTNYIGELYVWKIEDGHYKVTYEIDDTIEIDGIEYEIMVMDEHLAISDSINFTAKPGKDDNADFDVPFEDDDGCFFIFAHFDIGYY